MDVQIRYAYIKGDKATGKPETKKRQSQAGNPVVNFTVYEMQKNGKGDDATTSFVYHKCVAFKHVAEDVLFLEGQGYFKANTAFYVAGYETERKYKDNDGVDRTIREITVTNIAPSARALGKASDILNKNVGYDDDYGDFSESEYD